MVNVREIQGMLFFIFYFLAVLSAAISFQQHCNSKFDLLIIIDICTQGASKIKIYTITCNTKHVRDM